VGKKVEVPLSPPSARRPGLNASLANVGQRGRAAESALLLYDPEIGLATGAAAVAVAAVVIAHKFSPRRRSPEWRYRAEAKKGATVVRESLLSILGGRAGAGDTISEGKEEEKEAWGADARCWESGGKRGLPTWSSGNCGAASAPPCGPEKSHLPRWLVMGPWELLPKGGGGHRLVLAA